MVLCDMFSITVHFSNTYAHTSPEMILNQEFKKMVSVHSGENFLFEWRELSH